MFKNLKQSIQSAIILAILAIGAFFMANVELPSGSHYISAVNVLLFALPSFWAVKMWLGRRHGLMLIAILAAYALLIETAAIITGFPYGHFGYSEHLGFKLFGLVPWTVAFAWPPLMLASFAIAHNLAEKRISRIALTVVIITLFDLVLDPGAVALGFWSYPAGGAFYGVPLSNFTGWIVSGLIGSVIFETAFARFKPLLPTPVQLTTSAVFIIFFWTALDAFAGLAIPAILGAVIFLGLILFYSKYYFSFDEMIVLVDEDNTPVATERKSEVHTGDTLLHRAFSLFIFNARGELLLQRRSLAKKTWPGVWSNSCCGHTMLFESAEKAGARRLAFELGLKGIALTMTLPHFRYRAEKDGVVENEICPVLIGFTDNTPQPNPDEVAEYRWIDWQEFLRTLKDGELELSPWAIEEVELLAQSEIFKQAFAKNKTASA